MEIRLSPELEAVVANDMASGRYNSVDAYIAEAVELLHEREQWRGEALAEEREGIEAAWQEAEGGELMSLEDFRDEMKKMKTAWVGEKTRV